MPAIRSSRSWSAPSAFTSSSSPTRRCITNSSTSCAYEESAPRRRRDLYRRALLLLRRPAAARQLLRRLPRQLPFVAAQRPLRPARSLQREPRRGVGAALRRHASALALRTGRAPCHAPVVGFRQSAIGVHRVAHRELCLPDRDRRSRRERLQTTRARRSRDPQLRPALRSADAADDRDIRVAAFVCCVRAGPIVARIVNREPFSSC